ncbi:MAG: YfiR family protein [Holophaga sp.]|nr:YfiR family protein [Holophaga sp.]
MHQAWRKRRGLYPARAVVLAGWILLAHGPLAASASTQALAFEEYETRAAFILSLAKFTEWPETSLPPGEPLVIGVMGESPLARALDGLARAPWMGRRVLVRRLRRSPEAQGCQILYFPGAEEQALPAIRTRLAAQGTLTIGETSFFMGYGGAMQLFNENGKLRFILNRSVLDQSRLRVAAQVQRLAKQVINQP